MCILEGEEGRPHPRGGWERGVGQEVVTDGAVLYSIHCCIANFIPSSFSICILICSSCCTVCFCVPFHKDAYVFLLAL